MNATCPRCGTINLAGSHATRLTCKTCRLRFCGECVHWKVDRKQKYCARCGSAFSSPPPVVPLRLSAAILYIPIVAAILLSAFLHLRLWQVAVIAGIPPVLYMLVYLARFYRFTGLEQAARREAAMLMRGVLTLATIVYVVTELGNQTALIISVGMAVLLVLVGLRVQGMSPVVLEELRNNRSAWGMVLSMSNWDAFRMRFPDMRRAKAP